MTRIIAGAAGSLRLEVPKAGTRPTSDRVREAIFSSLASWNMIDGCRVLDLYAGSGALGLEAVSRGAAAATLVEKHPQAAQVAQRNARTVASAFREGSPRIEVARQSVRGFLEGAAGAGRTSGSGTAEGSGIAEDSGTDPKSGYEVVFIDPPYELGETELSADLAALVPLLAEDAVVMVERSSRSPEPGWPAGLEPIREKRYGETTLWWAEPGVSR